MTDLSQVEAESARLYLTLQDAVDREIQEVGFMPDATTYGMNPSASNGAGEHHRNGGNGNGHAPRRFENGNGNGHANGNGSTNGNGAWRCSDKQRDLIEKIVRENHLDKRDVDQIAGDMFGVGVKRLDRMQASGLIDDLFERYSNKPRGQKRPYRREPARVNAQGGGEWCDSNGHSAARSRRHHPLRSASSVGGKSKPEPQPQTKGEKMSHFTTIQTQVRDLDALRAALGELGVTLHEKTNASGYAGNQLKSDYVERTTSSLSAPSR